MAVLHHHELGDPDGAPLLAVHGITGHGLRYRDLAEKGWPERRTIAVDLRGHGRSPAAAPWNVDQHVADLLDTLDALGLGGPVDVIGHSYGGLIAAELMATAPQRVGRLVMLDPAIDFDPTFAHSAAKGVFNDPGFASPAEALMARQASVAEPGHRFLDAEIAEHLVEQPDGRWRYRFDRCAVVTGWGEIARPLSPLSAARPTLLVIAEAAAIVRDATVDRLRAELGDQLRVERLPCGHMLYWEAFDDTVALVRGFLDG